MYVAMELLVSLAISFWIYGDARERKLYDALTWGMIGFVFGIFGLAGYWYWIIRPNKRNTHPINRNRER
jgi:O-antigen/teichoic acid export membrane protein